ncbi:MAG: hypothetical protein P8P30_02075 [Rickettsiales bacterium]|nr:hypothetical protein [Rickettsiales bacterium]
MRRTIMFFAICLISGIITYSLTPITVAAPIATGAAIGGAFTITSACIFIAVGGIIDGIIHFAGGKSALADVAIGIVTGKKK